MATSSEGLSSTDLDLNDLPEWAKLSELITAIGLTLGEEARNYLHEEIDGRDDLPTFVHIPELLVQLRELGLQDEGLSSTDLNLNDLPESAHLSEVITAIGQKLGEEARNYLHEKIADLDDLPTLVNVPKLLKEIQELNGGDEETKEAHEEATETTTTMVTSPSSWDRMNDKFEISGFQSYIKESISLPLHSDLADDPEVTTASVPPPAPNSEDFRSSGSANNLVETRSTFHIAPNNSSALTREDFEAATSSEVSIHGESGSQNLYPELLNLSDLAEQEMYGTSAGHMTDASSSRFHSMFGADYEEPDLDVEVYLFKPDQSLDRP